MINYLLADYPELRMHLAAAIVAFLILAIPVLILRFFTKDD